MPYLIAGTSTPSVDVFFCDDSGLPLTGKVAADFPTVYFSISGANSKTTITLSDLAAETTAYSSGGLKERAGGWYRLDLPTSSATTAGSKVTPFGYSTDKNVICPTYDVMTITTAGLLDTNIARILGTASAGHAGYVGLDWGQMVNKTTANVLSATQIYSSQVFGHAAQFNLAADTATAGTTTSITGSIALGNDNCAVGCLLKTHTGTGLNQVRLITAYNNSTKVYTFTPAMSPAPASGTTFYVIAACLPIVDSSLNIAGNVNGNLGGNVVGNVNGNVVGSVASVTATVAANLTQILGTALTETSGYLAAGFKKFFNIQTPVHTVGSVDQTGDAYGRIGSAGVGLTNLGDTRIANLDTTVSSRSTLTSANVWDYLTSSATTAGSIGKRIVEFMTTLVYVAPTTPPTAVENAAAVWDRQTSLVTTAGSIGKRLLDLFSGITTLGRWLGLLAGKTADSTTLAELNAMTGAATYSNTTMSLEAINANGVTLTSAYDRAKNAASNTELDAAEAAIIDAVEAAAPGTFPTADEIANAIESARITLVSPLSVDGGTLTFTRGDDLYSSEGTAPVWTITREGLPSWSGATAEVRLSCGGATTVFPVGTSYVSSSGDTGTITANITSRYTSQVEAGTGTFQVAVQLANTHTYTEIKSGTLIVQDKAA